MYATTIILKLPDGYVNYSVGVAETTDAAWMHAITSDNIRNGLFEDSGEPYCNFGDEEVDKLQTHFLSVDVEGINSILLSHKMSIVVFTNQF